MGIRQHDVIYYNEDGLIWAYQGLLGLLSE